MSSNNNIGNIFQGLFGRKNQDKPATPQERAAKALESYEIDSLKKGALVDKLAAFEEAYDNEKSASDGEIKLAEQLVKQAEEDNKKANDTVKAAKAVGLRAVTLSKEIQAARKAAEVAKEEAKTKVEALEKATKESSTLGNQLIAGLTDPRLDVETMLNLTEEEIKSLFGAEEKVEAPKAAPKKVEEKVEAPKAAPKEVKGVKSL